MNAPLRKLALPLVLAAAALMLGGCEPSRPVVLNAAPPGPSDLGPAAGLSTPPAEAVVFDLKYRAQTGGADDIAYHSFWGYGGSDEATKTNSFLAAVRQKASNLHYVYNATFTGRNWSAVEYHGTEVTALYFDLDADGKLTANERILPTRKLDRGYEFITPDFVQPLDGGGQTLCRALLQVNFYIGNSTPNTMWSPASLLEGTATIDGRPVRLMLLASQPGGAFDQYGSSSYALLWGAGASIAPNEYFARETLSSVIASENRFYRLALEGRRTNGLPARALLQKDTSPTGQLAVKLTGSNALSASLSTLYVHGVEDKTVCFNVSSEKDRVNLPVGTYALDRGTLGYGANNREWSVSFSQGPLAVVKADAVSEQELGQPTLKVRAIREDNRWLSGAAESATYKRGTRIYLEPKIVGKNHEIFTRFRHAETSGANRQEVDRPPHLTITGPDGKQVLSKTMEYG